MNYNRHHLYRKFFFLSLFIIFFSINGVANGQDLCPPAFLNGTPMDGAVELSWQPSDTLSGYGDEVFTACFPVCATASEGFTIEHMGQDTSGGWFQASTGDTIDCGMGMFPCTDGDSQGLSAIASWSDTLAPVNSRLSTDLIDLSSYSTATLYFDEYYSYTSFSHDSNWVEVSTNGTDWTAVHVSSPSALGDGSNSNLVDLTAYAGQSIYLGFRFYDSIGFNEIWYVDNIRVFGGNGAYVNNCGTFLDYEVLRDGSPIATTTSTNYTDSGLTNGVEYCYTIIAEYSEGESTTSAEACFTPVVALSLSQDTFTDTLDYSAGEYSVHEFSLINSDTVNYYGKFWSEPTYDAYYYYDVLLYDDFNSGASNNFFPSAGFWTIGTVDSANGLYLTYPEDTDGAFYFHNDGESWYTTYDPTNSILQSQAIPYTGAGPVFFYVDMYFPQPYGGCSSGGTYSEDASIVVSTDNGATWTEVENSFRTGVTWDGYYAYDPTEASWHTLMYNLTPYISEGIFNVGILYDDCGGNWSSGIGVDNIWVTQGDEDNWLSWERLSFMVVPGDTMSMSLTMMPQADLDYEIEGEIIISDDPSFYYNQTSMTVDISMIMGDESSIIDVAGLPDKFALHQNFPNPFNPTTTLRYDLPEQANVNITIYDLLGRQVASIINQEQKAGFQSVIWNATNDLGNPVSAGIYLCEIKAGKFVQTKKLVLLK
ncbi:MAG: hypothetical protein CMG29_05450 [Candidatus Marinimicrobia bacterium]|nr:hypothetical protein [Candidatus Neomarinimicrobiota bacterium]